LNKSSKETPININYTKNQLYLFDLLDNYKREFNSTKEQYLKDSIQNKYGEKIQLFLVDSLGRYIDSVNVTVDTVFQEGWLVTTQFHSREIMFKYGMNFKDSMDSRVDSLYHWMRNLKPKSNMTLNFSILGSGQLNSPNDSINGLLKIFALPEPLRARPKQ
jgi:hypothetical protein